MATVINIIGVEPLSSWLNGDIYVLVRRAVNCLNKARVGSAPGMFYIFLVIMTAITHDYLNNDTVVQLKYW